MSACDGKPAAVGGDQAQVRLLAVDQHARDRVARVVARGRERGAVDQAAQRARIDLEVEAVARAAHAGELARLVAEDLEGRALGRDGREVAVDRHGHGRVVAGAHDLVELVGGNQRLAVLLHIDIGDGDDQADLAVGRADLEDAALGDELEAGQHGGRGAGGHDAAGHGQGIGQRKTVADELHRWSPREVGAQQVVGAGRQCTARCGGFGRARHGSAFGRAGICGDLSAGNPDLAGARIPSQPMLYRILRGITEVYPAVWLGIFMLLAVIAFAFTVIYPLVPIVLVISSVFLVVAVRCGYLALKWIEHRLAREALVATVVAVRLMAAMIGAGALSPVHR